MPRHENEIRPLVVTSGRTDWRTPGARFHVGMGFTPAENAQPEVPHKEGLACVECGARETPKWRGIGGRYCSVPVRFVGTQSTFTRTP